jgi:acyl-coenzyme A thioesterase 13
VNRVAYKFIVPAETVNLQGSMHGGALSTLVDIVTTISILKATPIKNASINLSTEFLSPAKINSELVIETFIKKLGTTIVFTDCEIFHDNKLIAKGIHTKAFAK